MSGELFHGDVAPLEAAPESPPRIDTADVTLIDRALQGQDVDGDGISTDDELAAEASPFRADTDRDGIPDALEIAHGGNPNCDDTVDADCDGYTNAQEAAAGTDPYDPDTDGDGVEDDQDPAPRSGVHWRHTDLLGSAVLVTGQAQVVIARLVYAPYGGAVVAANESKSDVRFGFTGQRLEAGVQLYDYGARWYDHATGRFLQPDPVVPDPKSDPQALNRYAYALGNPANRIDPSGNTSIYAGPSPLGSAALPVTLGFGYDDYSFSYLSSALDWTFSWMGSYSTSPYSGYSSYYSAALDPFTSSYSVGFRSSYTYSSSLYSVDTFVSSTSYGTQVAALGAGLGTGALVGGGTAYALAGLTAVCLPCGVAVGVGALAYTGYELYQDSQNDFVGIREFAGSVGSVLSGNATASEAFQVGFVGGSVAGGMAGSRAGYTAGVLGSEIRLGSNLRIAPFGNRTGNPTGRFSHYHRRVPDPSKPGESLSGQGIKRHRPWDTKPSDTSFWDRF